MIYFDNAATTKVSDRALEKVNMYMTSLYANSSSLHSFGFNVENDIKKASLYVKKYISAKDDSTILWTSGGTESNNMALREAARSKGRSGKHILSTKYEHPSVLNNLKRLEEEGFLIEYIDIDSDGHIILDDLKNKLRDDTILVSIMHVNNEIGSINDIESAGKIIKEKNKDIIFHVDAIQSFGKLRINVDKMNIDLLSASAHKIHGPKGVGLLYISGNVKIKALIEGGGQQENLRSGTLNAPGIMGFVEAIKEIDDNFDDINNKIIELNQYFKDLIKDKKYFALSKDNYSPYIVSIIFPSVRSEVMLHTLENNDIYVGAGSACGSHKKHESAALKSLGIDNDNMDKMVRFSLSRYNEKDEIKKTVEVIDANYDALSKFIKK